MVFPSRKVGDEVLSNLFRDIVTALVQTLPILNFLEGAEADGEYAPLALRGQPPSCDETAHIWRHLSGFLYPFLRQTSIRGLHFCRATS